MTQNPTAKMFVTVCCNAQHLTDHLMMEEHNEITCRLCGRLMAAKSGFDGEWYFVGNKVFL